MKINGHKVKASIKNVYRKTLKAALATGLVFSSVIGGYNVARETYEEIKGNNLIVDLDLGFGSFVIENKDTRTAMQVFDDAKKAALSVNGLEDAYLNGGSWSIGQKKEFITNFSKEVAKSAGVRLEKVEFVPRNTIDGANGVYRGDNNKFYTFTQNKIWIAEDMLDLPSMVELIKTAYHETVHLKEGVNIQTMGLNNIDADIFNSQFTYGEKEVYRSNFKEFTAQLLSMELMLEMANMFGREDVDYTHYIVQYDVMEITNEIIKNDMYYNGTSEDYYKNLTVRELLNLGLKNNYKNKNISVSDAKLQASYTNEIIERTIPKVFLDANYHDFSIGSLQFRNLNLQSELYLLLVNINDFKEGNYENLLPSGINTDFMSVDDFILHAEQTLSVQMVKVATILRYGQQGLNEQDRDSALDTILNSLDLIPQSQIDYYRLDAVEELRNGQTAVNSEIDDEMTR